MNNTTTLLHLAQTGQSLALAGHSFKLANKKKKKLKDFVSVGVTNIVGIPLIQSQAALAASF